VTHTDPATIRTHKNKISSDSFREKLKKQLTLKNFTIISIVLILVGLMQHISSLNNYQVLFQPIFEIGILLFIIAYFLYAVKCWGAAQQICAVLMVALPLLTYFLAISKIPDSTTNVLFYLAIQLGFSVIIAAILLYLSYKVKTGLEKYVIKKSRNYYWYSKVSYPVIGVIFVSFLMMNYGGIATFSENIDGAFKSTTNYPPVLNIFHQPFLNQLSGIQPFTLRRRYWLKQQFPQLQKIMKQEWLQKHFLIFYEVHHPQ